MSRILRSFLAIAILLILILMLLAPPARAQWGPAPPPLTREALMW